MTRIPVRIRLTLAFALVMALVLGAVGALVYVRVGDALLTSVDQTLHSQAREAAARVRGEHGLVDPDTGGGVTLAQAFDAQGGLVETSRAGLAPLLSGADASRVARGATILRSVERAAPPGDLRVLAVPADGGGAVVVARSLSARDEALHRLSHELQLAFLVALLLAAVAGYALAASALRPVEAMRRRAQAVTAARPGRLPVPRARDELARLAETLNDMLARLEQAFEHEQRFVADASHELRTPLALLRTEIDLALRRPRSPAELESALRSAGEETERLSRLAEDLLLLARAEQGGLPIRREQTSVADLFEQVARRAQALGPLRIEPTELVVDADPLRLEQALGNLVDNAFAHGAGPVMLSARRDGGRVELHVADSGAGFPEAFLARAFDRFSRADSSRSGGGAGLGLSIVALIAEAHGGSAHALNTVRGADVWLSLEEGAGRRLDAGDTRGAGRQGEGSDAPSLDHPQMSRP